MPLMRTMSMEHRWQDLANFLSLPDGGANLSSHHHHHGHHGHHTHPGHPGHHPHSPHHGLSHHPHALTSHSHHAHPFAHPHPYPHGHVHPHSHATHPPIHTNAHYSVHSAAAAAVGHHYGGLPTTATPVAAYSTSDMSRQSTGLVQNASIGSTLTELGANGSYPSPNIGKD